ncbi:hypothetical protein DRN85_05145 [Methanosarcinales archaeon]|nr:MAG: hypothetical protein DRN85_05145 [Methanosarcinales archaeon]
MTMERGRGRNLRTAVGITTLTILLLLACAGTAAGARWGVDDSGGANYTSIGAEVDAAVMPFYEETTHHHPSSFDHPPWIREGRDLRPPAPERIRRARVVHTSANPPEEEWKRTFGG